SGWAITLPTLPRTPFTPPQQRTSGISPLWKQADPLCNRGVFCENAEPYCGFAEAAGEAAGGVVPAGKTPAPESGAGEAPGDVWGTVVGAGEACGARWVFISSRRKALSAVLLWA